MKKYLYKVVLRITTILPISSLAFAAQAKSLEINNNEDKTNFIQGTLDNGGGQTAQTYNDPELLNARDTLFDAWQMDTTFEDAKTRTKNMRPDLNDDQIQQMVQTSVKSLLEKNLIKINETIITSQSPSRGGE